MLGRSVSSLLPSSPTKVTGQVHPKRELQRGEEDVFLCDRGKKLQNLTEAERRSSEEREEILGRGKGILTAACVCTVLRRKSVLILAAAVLLLLASPFAGGKKKRRLSKHFPVRCVWRAHVAGETTNQPTIHPLQYTELCTALDGATGREIKWGPKASDNNRRQFDVCTFPISRFLGGGNAHFARISPIYPPSSHTSTNSWALAFP